MAVVNRRVIGTVACYSQGCDQVATVHQIEKGTRTGQLYLRCPECKAIQQQGEPLQSYILEKFQPRPEYEHLKNSEPNIKHAPRYETETVDQQVSEQVSEQVSAEPDDLENKPKLPLSGLLALVVAGIGIALGIGGLKNGK